MRGGYQIIDLKGKNFEPGISQYVEGVYELIEGTTKPIMISNFVFAGVKQHDFFAIVKVVDSSYVIETPIQYAKRIVFNDTDAVFVYEN